MVAAMLARREVAFLDCTGIPEAAVSLQEELHAFPPAKPTFRFAVSSQFLISFFVSIYQIDDLRFAIDEWEAARSTIVNRKS